MRLQHGNRINCSRSAVCARWRGPGIFSLAPGMNECHCIAPNLGKQVQRAGGAERVDQEIAEGKAKTETAERRPAHSHRSCPAGARVSPENAGTTGIAVASFMIGPRSKRCGDCILAYPSGVLIGLSRPFALDTAVFSDATHRIVASCRSALETATLSHNPPFPVRANCQSDFAHELLCECLVSLMMLSVCLRSP